MSLRRVNCTIALFLVFQMIVPSSILAAAVGQFTAVTGAVSQTSEGMIIKPQVKSPIQLKDLIVTGDLSSAAMLFEDESTITLAQKSKFEVKEFAIKDNIRRGLFSLAIGKLTADVQKFIGGNSSFEVHTPTAIAGVRGTGFEIVVAMVGTQLTTTVTCTAGVLSVSALSITGVVISTTTIVAGQTAVITANGITVSATGAAGTAGATAGAATAAGVTAGTIAIGVAVAAVAVAAVASAASGTTATTHHH
ncbi:MAG: FecR domain-containing protein [Proteobacteria bacterium]|nr:FecR domain-containing protein [Pseudomonadota bacterium]